MDATARAFVNRLVEQNGGSLKTVELIEAARSGESPIHKYFTWDVRTGMEKLHEIEARQLIRVYVIEMPHNEQTFRVRGLVSLSSDRAREGGGYRQIERVLEDAEWRKELLADALAEMRRFEMKYAVLQELTQKMRELRKRFEPMATMPPLSKGISAAQEISAAG